jgi:hypothetical protein
MNKYSPALKTVMAIVISGILVAVLLPLAFFLKVAFSSNVEMSQFPKSLVPDLTVTVQVTPQSDGSFDISFQQPDGSFTSILTSSNPGKIETLFHTQYSVDQPGQSLLQQWAPLQQSGQTQTFTYRKDML